ncbi:hypothetical protein A3848_06185 [Paenibacillus sp. P32E]|nr:hypothetical protein A3848_06185 [Paenibacillus sp. P32E]
MKTRMKLLLIVISIFCSIVLPVLILELFHLLFPEFYTKGFLTGLGHLLICGLMIILNIVTSQIIIHSQYNKGKEDMTRYIIIFIIVSIILQVTLSIMIENPFKDPPLPNIIM